MSPVDPLSGAPLPYPGDPGMGDPNAGIPPELAALLGGGAPPPRDTGGPTSPNQGTPSDILREVVRLLNLYIQVEESDQAIAEVQAIIAKVSSRLAKEESARDKGLGIDSKMRAAFVGRV